MSFISSHCDHLPLGNLKKENSNFKSAFSLGSFVSDENISNSLSLSYRYLGASYCRQEASKFAKKTVAIQTETRPKIGPSK